METFCDLHTHSTYSDGTCTPAEIIAQADALGLSAVALTDHNTVAGIPDFLAAARDSCVEAIPGVEISTGYHGTEVHIVGLFLPPDRLEEVACFVERINHLKERNYRALAERLQRAGYSIDYDTIRESHPQGTVNRAVIARVLLEKGYVSSIEDAFQTLLSRPGQGGYYLPPDRIHANNAVHFLASLGAVPILAHPFLTFTEETLRRFLPWSKHHGLIAMETMYSTYSPETTALARNIAREFGLKESGGSDFHGQTKPHISLGTGKGSLSVPSSIVDKLKNSR